MYSHVYSEVVVAGEVFVTQLTLVFLILDIFCHSSAVQESVNNATLYVTCTVYVLLLMNFHQFCLINGGLVLFGFIQTPHVHFYDPWYVFID